MHIHQCKVVSKALFLSHMFYACDSVFLCCCLYNFAVDFAQFFICESLDVDELIRCCFLAFGIKSLASLHGYFCKKIPFSVCFYHLFRINWRIFSMLAFFL